MTRRHGAHDRARPAAIFFQMIKRERQNLVRRQPRSVLVHNAKTIRVAVETKSHLRLAVADKFAHVGHVLRVRFGMMPAEQRIQFVVKQRDLRADFFEQHVEITVAGAVTQINGDFQFRFFKNGKFKEFVKLFEIRRLRIDFLVGERAKLRRVKSPMRRLQFYDIRLDLLRQIGRGRRAVERGKFQALILGGIVAGGHVDAANRLAMTDGVRDDGRGRVAIAEQGFNAVGRKNFGGGEGKFASEKTRVVAENQNRLAPVNFRFPISDFRFQVVRDALCGETDIIEGEVARNDIAPAGGAEFDYGHKKDLEFSSNMSLLSNFSLTPWL